ncbi:helix-turn-helix domain-containing protein [Paenibacillus cymbidii]|uniref:helix-turn-helix domain-containing protein n=1 Tax=Paenibacillus cymbidii TaxID=1639034 RepID=UPI0010801363|nr:AraC family transcriptional regulator [Paenibacillus cymbidii]
MDEERLPLTAALPVQALNGGLFLSRGIGRHPVRTIDSYEMIVVQSGTLGIFEEDRRFDVEAGQALLLRPHRKHGGTKTYPADLSFYWVHFRLHGDMPAGAPPLFELAQLTTLSEPEPVIELFRRFLDRQEQGRRNKLPLDLLMLEMLSEIAGTSDERELESSRTNALAARADSLLRTHFHEPVSTAWLAERLGCNPDYLGRVYHRRYVRTLTDALHEYRLKHACQLLLEGTGNIDEIARRSGYADAAYFRRMFKRYKGVAPSHYKKKFSLVHVNTE